MLALRTRSPCSLAAVSGRFWRDGGLGASRGVVDCGDWTTRESVVELCEWTIWAWPGPGAGRGEPALKLADYRRWVV